jgi:hypothetical protein
MFCDIAIGVAKKWGLDMGWAWRDGERGKWKMGKWWREPFDMLRTGFTE